MDVQEILEMWQEDCQIDQFKLDDATIKIASLHSKYLGLITVAKIKKKDKDLKFKMLLKDKWLYYNGKMNKGQMDMRSWDYDPFNGLNKPLKGDMNYYYDADADIQKSQAEIEYMQTLIDTLKEIMDTIRWRHQSISNIIKWRSFEAGV
jgi:hypothetical protein